MFSRSDRVPEAFKIGGGASIAAIFFLLFFDEKKLPKKPGLESPRSRLGLADRCGIVAEGGRGFPVFGSTCVGFDAFCRSLMIAIAYASIVSMSLDRDIARKSYPVSSDKIRMASVDIASFHGNEVLDKLIRWLHDFLEKRYYDSMESFL